MQIPDEILKCVVFLGYDISDGDNERTVFAGTGFIMNVPFEDGTTDSHHIYLVTAHHNYVAIKKHGLESLRISINRKDGGKDVFSVPPGLDWFGHPNHESDPADVVVMPLPVDLQRHDIRTIPIGMLVNESQIQDRTIAVGNDVFVIGLFTRHFGKQRNLPIVRVGNIAMISQEKVRTSSYGEMDAYLIEARSIGGISGSPVFFQHSIKVTEMTISVMPTFSLGGLIHGHYPTSEDVIDFASLDEDISKKIEEKHINMGIAIVTPAAKIRETLEQPRLHQLRTAAEKAFIRKTTHMTKG